DSAVAEERRGSPCLRTSLSPPKGGAGKAPPCARWISRTRCDGPTAKKGSARGEARAFPWSGRADWDGGAPRWRCAKRDEGARNSSGGSSQPIRRQLGWLSQG